MRGLVATASLLAALWLATPESASAQDPPPPPPTPEAPPPAPPPPQARERQTAVPRAERARETAERATPRGERTVSREPEGTRDAQSTAPPAPQPSAERAGAVRRDQARDNAAREIRTGEDSTRRRAPVNASNESPADAAPVAAAQGQSNQRPGAVRRPPTDNRGGTVSPRDRAVVRTSPPPNRDHDHDYDHVYVYPSYWSYGHYYDPFYFHLGYLAYSPWGWMPAFYGYPYGYAAGSYQAHGYDIGRVRLKVKPRDAEVLVDGYYAGTVDDFDGMMQSLRLDSGSYRIEIRKPGFETLYFDVRVQPDRTITYRGEMRPSP
jgi:hypothetical protein